MFAISPVAVNTTAPPATSVAAAAFAAGTGSLRGTASAVSTPLASTPVQNDGRNPAAFLTQVISQGDDIQEDSQIALADNAAHFSPAPQYNELVAYGVVKFRPSDAGLSLGGSLATGTTADSSEILVSAVPNNYQAYSVTQSRNQSNLIPAEPQLSLAG